MGILDLLKLLFIILEKEIPDFENNHLIFLSIYMIMMIFSLEAGILIYVSEFKFNLQQFLSQCTVLSTMIMTG